MTHTSWEKMEYLVKTTGHDEARIVAEAMEKGFSELYRERISDADPAEKLNRNRR